VTEGTDETPRPGARADNPGCHGEVLALIEQLTTTGADPLERLRALADAERQLGDARTHLAVVLLLDTDATNADVGRALGVSRQAVAKRYSDLVWRELRRRLRERSRQPAPTQSLEKPCQ
jgi:hypothetical protein